MQGSEKDPMSFEKIFDRVFAVCGVELAPAVCGVRKKVRLQESVVCDPTL